MYYVIVDLYRDSSASESVYPTQQIKVRDNEVLPEEVVRTAQRNYEKVCGYHPYAKWRIVNGDCVDAMLN